MKVITGDKKEGHPRMFFVCVCVCARTHVFECDLFNIQPNC